MADKKISQLTALSAANLAPSTDVLAIVDTSATETKKIVAQDLINGVLNVASAVGIGTASPAGRVSIKGSTSDSSANALFVENAVGGAIFRVRNDGDIYMGSGGKAILDTSGNLGLGVTPSAWSGSYKTIQNFGAGISSQAGSEAYYTANAYFNAGWKYIYSNFASRYEQINSAHQWYTAPSGTAGSAISFTQAMTLDASGNLGVGTSTPSIYSGYKSITLAGGATGGVIDISPSTGISTGGCQLSARATDTSIDALGPSGGSAAFLAFRTGTFGAISERARITAGGYFKASNDGTYAGSTATYHEFSQSADDSCLVLAPTNASFTSSGLFIAASRAANAAYYMIRARANAVDQFYVTGAGVIYAQNTTIQSLSDARLKENVRDASEGLSVINALRPVRYDWKEGFGNDRKNQLGFIAQEVETVFPEAVSDWMAKEGDEAYKTVGPAALIPVLVKAIQELEARLAALEAK